MPGGTSHQVLEGLGRKRRVQAETSSGPGIASRKGGCVLGRRQRPSVKRELGGWESERSPLVHSLIHSFSRSFTHNIFTVCWALCKSEPTD